MLHDSNIIIYAAQPGVARFDQWLQHLDACMASVTRIEVLGFPGFTALDLARQTRLIDLIDSLVELPLDETISNRAVKLRQQRKMTLADAIIAATALEYDVPLITRNVNDFRLVSGLKLINPFDIQP